MTTNFNPPAPPSPDSSEGHQGHEYALQRPLSNLPPEIINHIFGFWIDSVANVCTARRIFRGIDHFPEEYSPYRVFVKTLGLPLDQPNYPDSAMTIALFSEKDGSYPVNLNDFDPSKRSFFIYNRMHRMARDLIIDQMEGPHSQLRALLELQRLMPRIDMFEIAKNLLSQVHPDPLPLPGTDMPDDKHLPSGWHFARDPFQVNERFNNALIEVLKTYPNQKVLEDQEERIRKFFDVKKNDPYLFSLDFISNNVSVFINTIPITDIHDFIGKILSTDSPQMVQETAFLGMTQMLTNLIRGCLRIGRIDNAREFFKYFDPRVYSSAMLHIIDVFLQIEEMEIVEELKDRITEPFDKASLQIKIALAKKSLDELEEAKVLLMEAIKKILDELEGGKDLLSNGGLSIQSPEAIRQQRLLGLKALVMPQKYDLGIGKSFGIIDSDQQEQIFELECFRIRPLIDFLEMKILQAFLTLNELDKAKEFRNQLEDCFQQFQAQLEILKVDPSRDEFDIAKNLALRTKEKDILLTQLITEYLKTDALEKLDRAKEALTRITDPYYQIKARIQIIKASEGEEDYLTLTEMNEFMDSLLRADRRHWIQILEHREKLNFFQEMLLSNDMLLPNDKLGNFRSRYYNKLQPLLRGGQDELLIELSDCLMQEVQEGLMNVYIQKEDFTSAREVAQVMTRDKLQCRDDCILNLIDELLKRGRIQEAKSLGHLPGSSLFKALAQIRIAKASPNDKWEEELSDARVLIDAIPQVKRDNDTCWVRDIRDWLNKKSSYISEGFDYETVDSYDISECVDGRVYATFNLIAACIERNDSVAANMLLSRISPVVDTDPYDDEVISCTIVSSIDHLKQNLLKSFLKKKEFQIAETLLDLIPNPRAKLEALTTLIEAMFKRGA